MRENERNEIGRAKCPVEVMRTAVKTIMPGSSLHEEYRIKPPYMMGRKANREESRGDCWMRSLAY